MKFPIGCILFFHLFFQSLCADPNSHAELPHWPMGWQLPPPLGQATRNPRDTNADILVWLPPGAKQIRAMLIIPNNTDSKDWAQFAELREVAKRHEMGMVYLRRFHTGIEAENMEPPTDTTRMPALLKDIAERTGIREFEHAPWITFGKSSRGKFPFRMAWVWPERSIATIVYHGETPTWPIPAWGEKSKQHSILHVNANGETEWAGTWFLHVRPALLNYNTHTRWLTHVMVAKDVGHGDYGNEGGRASPLKLPREKTWRYLTLFVDKALSLRLPEKGYPSDGPLELSPLEPGHGYALDRFAVENLFQIPHQPLFESPDGFMGSDPSPAAVSGYVKIPPSSTEFPESTPREQLLPGKSPGTWLLTDSLKFAMRTDPMVHPNAWLDLRPALGQRLEVDGETLTFQEIKDNQRGPNGGIRLNTGLKPPNRNITLFAYTVLDVPEARSLRVNAGFTAATRIQLVLNGVPLKNQQVVELQPGAYPLLVILRMSANWERIEPHFGDVREEDVILAKTAEEENRKREEEATASGAGLRPLLFRAVDLSPEERKGMFRLSDRELAEAWIRLHAVHGTGDRFAGEE